jgi:predicted RNase H-like HicB family nuclease
MNFLATLLKAEDGWFVAECPALPGCVSQGKDEKEALENIKEALLLGSGLRIERRFKRSMR